MAEIIDETSSIESTTVGVYRTSSTVAGGRRFSFSAMVVVGDRSGRAGIGYAKSNQVPQAIEKAQKEGRRKMSAFQMQSKTIPHMVVGRFGATTVKLMPAAPGTGVIAGAAVHHVVVVFLDHLALAADEEIAAEQEIVALAADEPTDEPLVPVVLAEVAGQVAARARRRTGRAVAVAADELDRPLDWYVRFENGGEWRGRVRAGDLAELFARPLRRRARLEV